MAATECLPNTFERSILLRVKRKRDDTPLDLLLVGGAVAKKNKTSLINALEALTTSDNKENATEVEKSSLDTTFVFARIDTHESTESSKLSYSHISRKVKRLHSRAKKDGHSYIDQLLETNRRTTQLHSVTRRFEEVQRHRSKERVNGLLVVDITSTTEKSVISSSNGMAIQKHLIQSPAERLMESGIEEAYLSNDFSSCFELVRHNNVSIDFQRKDDGKSLLMAAAVQGRVDIIDFLLQRGARTDLLNIEGQTAAEIAIMQGHTAVGNALMTSSIFQKENDYVYDVYYLDPDAQQEAKKAEISLTNTPLIQLNTVAEDEFASLEVFNDVLDEEKDNSEYEDISEDSNCEDHIGNDYPEEEDYSDEDDSSDVETRMNRTDREFTGDY